MKLSPLLKLLVWGTVIAATATCLPAANAQDAKAPIAGRVQPIENTTGKTIKIGLISFPESNEFFSSVKVGSDGARDVLKGFNAEVEYVTVNDFTQDAVNAAGRATLLQGYDAIAFLPLDNGACPLIKDAVKANVKVAVFITTADCAEASGALFFHGEDLAHAWGKIAVPALIDMINKDPQWAGKDCKAGVITGAFAVPTHETMRLAILDGLKGTNVSPVSDGVEAENDVGIRGIAGQHDDRALEPVLAHDLAGLAAVHVRQANVEQDQLEALLLGDLDALRRSRCRHDLEIVVQRQLVAQRLAQLLVIVDQENRSGRAHDAMLPGNWLRQFYHLPGH